VSRTRLHIEVHNEPGKNMCPTTSSIYRKMRKKAKRLQPRGELLVSLSLSLSRTRAHERSLSLSPAQAALRDAVAGNHTNGKLDNK
jgi:hypothetical protein